ncbi:hypothetical protein IKQ26_03260 [bacterium]|nr:hypothetical protein [bacterium]
MNKISEIQFTHLPKKVQLKKTTSEQKEVVSRYDVMKMYSDSKTAEIRSGINISEDKKAFKELIEYNTLIRQKPKKITLDRNPIFMCDIPYQPNSFYRMIGEGGYRDFLETGTVRPKQNTKENYSVIYFEKGRANNLYSGGSEYIVESQAKRIEEGDAHYPKADMLEKDKDTFRIWHRTQSGSYEIVYDTMNDVLSRHKDFRFSESSVA